MCASKSSAARSSPSRSNLPRGVTGAGESASVSVRPSVRPSKTRVEETNTTRGGLLGRAEARFLSRGEVTIRPVRSRLHIGSEGDDHPVHFRQMTVDRFPEVNGQGSECRRQGGRVAPEREHLRPGTHKTFTQLRAEFPATDKEDPPRPFLHASSLFARVRQCRLLRSSARGIQRTAAPSAHQGLLSRGPEHPQEAGAPGRVQAQWRNLRNLSSCFRPAGTVSVRVGSQ